MESLIEAGQVAGVLDVTTTEWADELVGGVMSAGPTRLEAAAKTGTPAVIAPGCLDMVNFWAPETIPERYRGHRIYKHNENSTLVRTTPEENAELGEIIAGKLNMSIGPVAVYIPLRGISVISAAGRAVLLAGGRRRAVRLVEEASAAGHPGARARQPHQRRAVRARRWRKGCWRCARISVFSDESTGHPRSRR